MGHPHSDIPAVFFYNTHINYIFKSLIKLTLCSNNYCLREKKSSVTNHSNAPQRGNCRNELRIDKRGEVFRLRFQHGQLLAGEGKLSFGPSLHAEGDACLRLLHHLHPDEFQQFVQFGAA